MRRLVIAVALLALAGCGQDDEGGAAEPPARACTEIGCFDSARVVLDGAPAGARVTLCVDGRCERARSGLGEVGARLARDGGDVVRVTVTVRKGGRTIARASERLPVRTERPNGPGCPPVCRFVTARFDVPSGTLEAA